MVFYSPTVFLRNYNASNKCKYYHQHHWFGTGGKYILQVTFSHFIPLTLICICYVTLVWLMRFRVQVAPHAASGHKERLTATALTICLVFMVLTTPISVWLVLLGFYIWPKSLLGFKLVFGTVAEFMRMFNYSTNFFIYLSTSRQFRFSAKQLFDRMVTSLNSMTSTVRPPREH